MRLKKYFLFLPLINVNLGGNQGDTDNVLATQRTFDQGEWDTSPKLQWVGRGTPCEAKTLTQSYLRSCENEGSKTN